MRPLTLIFSGLNSYVRQTEIDFAPFQKDRIFGIFGETGAGKSTIIDAITFALFGKIDRVGNEIKTSMNPLSKKINVEFTFQVGSKTYQVNRTVSERKSDASLYQLFTGQPIPLADKTREVNEEISKLIGGFDYQEFTKVIALPQNKFSEFLSAKPVERAMLLEKIFSLEKYGEKLWDKATIEENRVFGELQVVSSALEQLADVSIESFKEKKRQKEKTDKELAKVKKQLDKEEKKLNELKELDKLLAEMKKVQIQMEQLHSRESDINVKKEKLQSAEKVAPLRRDIENMDEWKKEILKLIEKIKDLGARIASSDIELQFLKKEYVAFDEQKALRIGEIAVEMKCAREAIELSGTIKTSREKEKQAKDKLQKIKEKIAQIAMDLKDLKGNNENFEKSRRDIRQQRDQLKLTDKEEALRESLKAVEKEEGALRQIKESLNNGMESLQEDIQTIDDNRKEIQANWKKTLSDIILPEADQALEVLNTVRENAQEKLDKLIEEQHQEELRNKASVIAFELIDGKPCPVCGSREHPAPAVIPETEIIERIKKVVADQEKFLKRIKDLEKSISPVMKTLIESLSSSESTKQRVGSLEKEMGKLLDEVTRKTGVSLEEGKTIKTTLDDRQKRAAKLSKDLDDLQGKLDRTGQDMQALQSGLSVLQINKTKVTEEVNKFQDIITETEQKIIKLVGKSIPETLLKTLQEEKEAIETKTVVLAKNMERKEKTTKELKEHLASGMGSKEEIEKKLDQASARLKRETDFLDITEEEFRSYILSDENMKAIRAFIDDYNESLKELEGRLKQNEQRRKQLKTQEMTDRALNDSQLAVKEMKEKAAKLSEAIGSLVTEIERISKNLRRREEFLEKKQIKEKEIRTVLTLKEVLRGKDFVHFIVKQLGTNIINLASESFYSLSSERMSLKLSVDKFNFFVEDHLTGEERPVSTLSGGETFLASFSLALALSKHIQTMKARSIHFFFIDEGFGTLDDNALAAVTVVMDRLRKDDVLVGFITHRKELQELVSSQILVTRSGARGSSLRVVA